jgi:hypothetical protein
MIRKTFTSFCLAIALNTMLNASPDSVTIDTINNYHNWGWDVLVVQNKYITLGIVPSIGARVLQYDLGTDTFMIVNEALFGDLFYSNSPTPYSTTWGYGGYKTWPAPQSNWGWPPPPTLAWGNYEYEVFQNSNDSVVIWMKGQTETYKTPGLRFDRYMTIYRNSTRIKVTTVLFNDNTSPQEWGIWDNTQTIVRHNPETDYQNISVYFPITSQDDIRYSTDFQGTVPDRREILPGIEQVKYSPLEGKIFATVPKGWVCVVDERDRQAYAKVFDVVEGADYPDDGGIVQLYTNQANKYMEVEVTGPLANIGANGDSIVFTEYWYTGRSAGPVYNVNHAGIVKQPLVFNRTSKMTTGQFCAFNEGELRFAYLNDAEEVISNGPTLEVEPDTLVDLNLEVDAPEETRYIDLQAYDADGSFVGSLDRYDNYSDDSFTAVKTTTPVIIDGIASEDCWANAEWYPLDFVWLPYNDIISSDDFTGRFKITWNDSLLYFLVEVVDDSLYDGHPDPLQNYWDDDCVEVFLDEDHSGGNHLNNFNAFAYHVSTLFDVVDNGLTGPALFNNDITADWTVQGHTYTWELAVKVFDDSYLEGENNVPVTLTNNKVMGFSMAYCDNDGSPARENFIGSKYLPEAESNNSYIDASIFGTLTLYDPNGPGVGLKSPIKQEKDMIRIFPNPAGELLFYSFAQKNNENYIANIRNLTGQMMYSGTISAHIALGEINIGNLESGVYVIEFISQHALFTQQIVKL